MLYEFAERIATKLIVRYGFEDKRTVRYITIMERLGVLWEKNGLLAGQAQTERVILSGATTKNA